MPVCNELVCITCASYKIVLRLCQTAWDLTQYIQGRRERLALSASGITGNARH